MAKKLAKILEEAGWKFVKSLGEGGQARLHVVTRNSDPEGTKFACKELKNSQNQQAFARFCREIDTIKSITHPSVIKIVDRSHENSERHFYIMEYIEDAVPLGKLLTTPKNPFYANALDSVKFFVSMLEAIQACEAKRVVHRDLSPGNVLVLPDHTVRIIDFGCCHLDLDEPITLTDENVGTPNYRAPECEAYSEIEITSQADLYSAAKILWSAVVNRPAFPRENLWQSESLSLRQLFFDQPDIWHLTTLFERSIRHNPNDRWKTTKEALSDARNVLRLITSRFLPVQAIGQGWCPVCGDKTLRPRGTGEAQLTPGEMSNFLIDLPKNNVQICIKCGYIMLVDQSIRSKYMQRFQGIE